MLIVDVLCYLYFLLLEDSISRLLSQKSYISSLTWPKPECIWGGKSGLRKQKTAPPPSESAELPLTPNSWCFSPHDVNTSQI